MSDTEIINAMILYSIFIERPKIINEDKAIIARPFEKVIAII